MVRGGIEPVPHLFSDFGVEPSALRSARSARSLERRRSEAALALHGAREALEPWGRGAHVFGTNKGQFSLIDLAAAVLERTGTGDVSVWTWCIAEYEIQAVTAFLVDGRIRTFRLVMDWAEAQRDMPLVADLQARFGLDCIRVTKTHAKIVTVSTDDGWRVVIRGSMNLNANRRFEQFDVSDDAAVFGVVGAIEAELWSRGKALPIGGMKHSDATALLGTGEMGEAAPGWAPAAKRWW